MKTRAMSFRKKPFWERVALQTEILPWSGCQIFTGYVVGHGYGMAHDGGRHRLIHRAAYEEKNGPIPEGMFVLHKCDVPSCFNTDHLFLGTLTDNNRDREAKGRGGQLTGAKHARPQAKLNDSKVLEILEELKSYRHGLCSILAKKYGVSAAVISSIRHGNHWRHVAR